MAAFPPPTPNEIFNTADFAAETGVLTIDTLKNYFLTYPIGQGTETIPALIVQGATNLQEDVSIGGDIYLTDTIGDGNNIYFQTADVTQASISVGTTGDMTFATNESVVYPLVLGIDNITMQSNEILINSSTTINLTSSDQMTLASESDMVLQALNNTNNAYIEFDTTFIRTLNTLEIDLTASGVIELTTPSTMTLTGDTINLVSDTITEVKTPNLDIFSPNAFTTYLQLIPTYAAGLADTATLYFGSTTQTANSYIGIDSLTSMAMTISSVGSIILNSAQDMTQLTNAPSGTIDAAIATVGYVNSGYIPIGQGSPIATIIMWAGAWNNLPAGFLLCNGQSISQATYSALYAVIGNYYGVATAGNFLLPNFVNTFPIGSESGGATTYPYSTILGSALSSGGSSTISLNQIPSHSHGIIGNNTGTGGGSSIVINPSGTAGTSTQAVGGGEPYAPPFQALQFLIKY
jgi:microcystin-dependent protein